MILKMKILFVISDSTAHGGTEILAFNVMHKLQEKGIECFMFSRYIYKGDNSYVLNMSQEDFVYYHRLKSSSVNKLMGGKMANLFLKDVIQKTAEKLQVDWIINHTYDLCPAIPTRGNWQTVQIFHWSIKGYEDVLKKFIRKKSLIPFLLSSLSLNNSIKRWHEAIPRFTRLVSLTKTAYSEIQKAGGLSTIDDIFYIPNPLMYTKPSKVVSSLNNNKIVYVGRLSYEKGVMRLLRIWELISKKMPDYTLEIYGDGHAQKDMENYIHSHNLHHVILKGFSSDLKEIYTNSDLCLMTSDTEGFGMVLIEAMYYGVPCVSFDCPVSPKEIIADAGIAIPCFDEEMYASRVIELLSDKEMLKKYQSKSIERAKDFYIDKVIDLWLEMLKQ